LRPAVRVISPHGDHLPDSDIRIAKRTRSIVWIDHSPHAVRREVRPVKIRPLLILLAIVLGMLIIAPPDTSAHANLESSAPAADSLLATPPQEIELTFSEPVDMSGVTVTAVDESGQPVKLDQPRLDPTNDRRVLVSSSDFSIGAYTVSWANRSLTDGHTLSGSFAFRVGGTDRAPAASTVEGQRPPAWAVVLRWLAFLGTAPAVGMLLLFADPRRRRIAQGGLAVAVVVTLLDPVLLSAFPPQGSVGGSIIDAVRAEPTGWWVRLAGLVLALVLSLVPWRSENWRLAVGAAGLIGIGGLALTSHASGRETYAWAATGVAFLHDAAVALWFGALALLVLAPEADRVKELGAFARRALPLAAVAVVAGLVNAGFIFPNIDTITSTDYGRVLISKAVIVALVLGLAAYHHLSLRGSLRALPSLMRNSVRLELGFIVLAVAFASTLSLLAPPQVTHGELAKIDLAMPTSPEMTSDQIFVRLTIDPAKTGENTLTSYATQGPPMSVQTDANGAPKVVNESPLTDVQLMRIELSSIDLPIAPRAVDMTPLGDGRFQSSGVNFSADGWWRAVVTVRRAGVAQDVTSEFILRVPDPNVIGFSQAATTKTDPTAEALYNKAVAQFAQQQWVVLSQDLSGGNGGVEVSSQIWSNGGLKIATPNITMIRLNGKRYLLDQTGQWRVTDDQVPGGPSDWVTEFDGATDFTLGDQEEIDGQMTQAVHFYVPGTVLAPAFYTWWVNVATGQIMQEAMISRSHYMIERLNWSAPPPAVTAPV
jgi:copper transport protein